jgi:hypothetical protein
LTSKTDPDPPPFLVNVDPDADEDAKKGSSSQTFIQVHLIPVFEVTKFLEILISRGTGRLYSL